jgi:hypothetical protein
VLDIAGSSSTREAGRVGAPQQTPGFVNGKKVSKQMWALIRGPAAKGELCLGENEIAVKGSALIK